MSLLKQTKQSITVGTAILAGGRARRLGGIAKGNLLNRSGITIIQNLLNGIELLRSSNGNGHCSDVAAANVNASADADVNANASANTAAVGVATDDVNVAFFPPIIVANPPFAEVAYRAYGVTIVADLWQDSGPLAGVASALNYYLHSMSDGLNDEGGTGEHVAVLIMPGDLPEFGIAEMERLIRSYCVACAQEIPLVFAAVAAASVGSNGDNDATIAATDYVDHPLCAVVSCTLFPQLQQAIGAGRRKVLDLWQEFGGERVLFGAQDRLKFANINSWDDLQRY